MDSGETEALKDAPDIELRLVRGDRRYSEALVDMARDFHHSGERTYDMVFDDLEGFFESITLYEAGENLPPDRVQQTEFWLLSDNRMLGGARLRHYLIPKTELDGGHIGYDIRPSERRQGYGHLLLSLVLREARAISLKKVLLTAERTNIASIRIIEKQGGVFKDTAISPNTGEEMLRFWISL